VSDADKKLADIFNIAGRGVLITGASGFFGRYMARTFLEVGANVILLSRSDRLLQQIADYKRRFGEDRCCGEQVDFYETEALDAALRRLTAEHRIDVVVNNAYDISPATGMNTPDGRLGRTPQEMWRRAMDSVIYWAVQTTQICGEAMRQRRSGSIINIASMYGVVSPSLALYEGFDFFNPPTYGVAKAGLIALTRYTASAWGADGVRCNAISPGPMPNTESASANAVSPEQQEFLDHLAARTVLRRYGHPTELRGALIFLASDASSFVTGHNLVVDGGWTIL